MNLATNKMENLLKENFKNEEKITYKEKKETIDYETGEIKEEVEYTTIKIPKEDNYIKLYIKYITYMHNLPKGLHPIIYELIKYVNYDNKIIINKDVKETIAKRLKIKENTIKQHIYNLSKENILIRVAQATYILNPYIFGKGNWKDIYELRKNLEIDVIFTEDKIIFKKLGAQNNEDNN